MAAFLLVTAALAAVVGATPLSVCSKAPYNNKAVLQLSTNWAFQSFCSSRFPIAPVTVTPYTTTTTSTATISTTTTIETTTMPVVTVIVVGTITSTETESTTSVETNTVIVSSTTTTTSVVATTTSTTTIVTNANGATYKRAVEPLPVTAMAEGALERRGAMGHGYSTNTRAQSASKTFASISGALSSVLSTACACVGKPKTLTATATVQASTTSTSTLSTTTTLTSFITTTQSLSTTTFTTTTETESSTTTTTLTSTFTTRVSATATATPVYNACGQSFNAPSTGTPIAIQCGQTIGGSPSLLSSLTTTSFYACLVAADDLLSSTSFTFQFSTFTCNIYFNNGPNNQYTANADFVYGYFYP